MSIFRFVGWFNIVVVISNKSSIGRGRIIIDGIDISSLVLLGYTISSCALDWYVSPFFVINGYLPAPPSLIVYDNPKTFIPQVSDSCKADRLWLTKKKKDAKLFSGTLRGNLDHPFGKCSRHRYKYFSWWSLCCRRTHCIIAMSFPRSNHHAKSCDISHGISASIY
jgi:hypothetical protein